MRQITIGELSKQTGCNIETIRYYEKIGLLPTPPRSDGGYRLYGNEHTRRVQFVRRARTLGFTLEEIRRLLRLAADGKNTCAEAHEVASSHLDDVRKKISDLRVMEHVLVDTVRRCESGGQTTCPLIEALSVGGVSGHPN
jgi:MerR family transcriptional regulator, mercuric resistance operon regulatory protein